MAEIPEPTRRSVLQILAIGTAGAVLAGCSESKSTGPDQSTAPATGDAAGVQRIMIIRHAEKQDAAPGPGLTQDGVPNDKALTIRGWTRAGGLAQLFAPSYGQPPEGLQRPDRVWSPTPQDNSGVRCTETVMPVAAKLGLKINDTHPLGDEAGVAAELVGLPGVTLVAWEHNHIPALVHALGHITPEPPKLWADNVFDIVFVFTRSGDGWTYRQVPQLLLAGDRREPML
ncbi:hypothetical protein [Smaragdicoccus niigatensis]|uniref:hypothetical protein n=1 Tax=Smaragdicoccus niigatensis TaxID=359359 RepID=UPI000378570C|nr:hypothetical protein [Smaragdicoccus niigatensis]